jgi:hypothetical protein
MKPTFTVTFSSKHSAFLFFFSRLKYVARFSPFSSLNCLYPNVLLLDRFVVGVGVSLLVPAPSLLFWLCPQRGQNLYEVRSSAEHDKQAAMFTLISCSHAVAKKGGK